MPPIGFQNIIKALGGAVTKQTSAYTPLLVLNFLVITASLIVYAISRNLAVFIPALLLLAYDIYRYDRYSEKAAHMLSTQSIQKYGMELGAMGDKSKPLEPAQVEQLVPEEGEIVDDQRPQLNDGDSHE